MLSLHAASPPAASPASARARAILAVVAVIARTLLRVWDEAHADREPDVVDRRFRSRLSGRGRVEQAGVKEWITGIEAIALEAQEHDVTGIEGETGLTTERDVHSDARGSYWSGVPRRA